MSATLLRSLEQAATAMELGEMEAAAAAMDAVAAACQATQAAGVRLPEGELKRAKELFARCQLVAERTQEDLLASLLQSARLRNASRAYGTNR